MTRAGTATQDRSGVTPEGRPQTAAPVPIATEMDASQLAARIRDEVRPLHDGGRLPPERDLAQRHGVSRARLRQALAQLESDGLIFRRHGKGTFAVPPPAGENATLRHLSSSVTPRDVAEVRMQVEPALAALAAERASEAELVSLDRLMRQTLSAHDARTYEIADAIFHFRIAELARNPLFLRVYDQIRAVRELAAWTGWRTEKLSAPMIADLGQQHRELMTRICARDCDGAAHAMQRHLILVAGMMSGGPLTSDGTALPPAMLRDAPASETAKTSAP